MPYHGPFGIGEYLRPLVDGLGGTPLFDEEHLTGLQLPDGGQVSLEHGGAIAIRHRLRLILLTSLMLFDKL